MDLPWMGQVCRNAWKLPMCRCSMARSRAFGARTGLRSVSRVTPEASPGPRDCAGLFDAFVESMDSNGGQERGGSGPAPRST